MLSSSHTDLSRIASPPISIRARSDEWNHCAEQLTAPSPRLPSGRLRESPAKTGVNALMSATGYGEGRGEGTSPQAQTRGEAPSPGAQERADLSPQAGRGKEAAASISLESALGSTHHNVRKKFFEVTRYPNRCRASFAPAPSAMSFSEAISRRIGAMPQFVHGTMRSRGR
jgi:hypothetical protein